MSPSVVVTPAEGRRRRRDKAVSDIEEAFRAALEAADPRAIVRRSLSLRGDILRVGSRSYDMAGFERVIVIGGGKASGEMAAAVEEMLGSRVTGGVVTVPDYTRQLPMCRRVLLHRASHPIPNEEGVEGVKKMLELVDRPTRSDLVVCLISGGGSALLPLPAKGLSLTDVQKTTDLLVRSGVGIDQINAVRKHLSSIKGGRLAERLYPATVLGLLVSDVVGDRPDVIASGPTCPDVSTFADAETAIKRQHLWGKVPARVRARLSRGAAGSLDETPKEGSTVFAHVHNVVVAGNRLSCVAAARSLQRNGYSTLVLSTMVTGEARELGRLFAGLARDMVANQIPLRPPACIVAGGETTVTVRGKGVGGRNQEFALAAAISMAGLRGAYVGSMGTDGVDGATRAAGALADAETAERARRAGLDPEVMLNDNDSNSFFSEVGGLVVTGPTGTNVNDIMLAMACE